MKFPKDLGSKDLQAVFIDLDGTLVNSLPKLYEVYFEFLKHYGIKGSQNEFDEINGPSLSEILSILQIRYQLPDPVPLLIRQYQSRIHQIYEDHGIVMEGAIETLRYLKNNQLKLVLVTSANHDFAKVALHVLDLEDFFDDSVTGEMVQKGKPNPEIYLLALKNGNLNAENVVVIEDSTHGVNAALKAGMYTLKLNDKVEKNYWYNGWGELKNWNEIHTLFQRWNDELSDH